MIAYLRIVHDFFTWLHFEPHTTNSFYCQTKEAELDYEEDANQLAIIELFKSKRTEPQLVNVAEVSINISIFGSKDDACPWWPASRQISQQGADWFARL